MDMCSRCGKKLRSQESREIGYGPVCYKKIFGRNLRIRAGGSERTDRQDELEYYDIPGQMSLEDFLGDNEQ